MAERDQIDRLTVDMGRDHTILLTTNDERRMLYVAQDRTLVEVEAVPRRYAPAARG
jgi:hypothetical protein